MASQQVTPPREGLVYTMRVKRSTTDGKNSDIQLKWAAPYEQENEMGGLRVERMQYRRSGGDQ